MQPHMPSRQQRERLELLMQQPVQELAAALARETQQFLKRQTSDDLIGLALFMLAAAQHNQEAWSCLYQQYEPLVLTWVKQHPGADPLLRHDGSGRSLVNAVFAKFFLALTPVKVENFNSLAAILKYLKLCAHSVITDEVRAWQRHARQYEEQLAVIEWSEPATADPADDVLAIISASRLWQVIQQELNGEEERIAMYLTYILEMKPGEIREKHHHLFPSVEDVYRVKQNVLGRLRRNRQLHMLYASS